MISIIAYILFFLKGLDESQNPRMRNICKHWWYFTTSYFTGAERCYTHKREFSIYIGNKRSAWISLAYILFISATEIMIWIMENSFFLDSQILIHNFWIKSYYIPWKGILYIDRNIRLQFCLEFILIVAIFKDPVRIPPSLTPKPEAIIFPPGNLFPQSIAGKHAGRT